ncbi:MAG: tRNA lysidine(34) synthetase TilS [Bacteroidetes bacterium 4572_128]|nr:MAG: tRNA lysidine(34) synthetase TilS [Bacteroidetes bacterium 4572_128]
MLKKFLNNIIKNKIFNKENKILLTVSGGIDSVVMFHLFLKTKLNFAVCHCNFKLREESDEDAIFVKKLSEENNIKYFETSFDTLKFAKENKFSIQMAARSLRYEWFEKIRNENNFDFIATAHNKNDITETFLINLARGTGIRGLTGIKIKKNKIIRPMINFSREEISDFKEKNKIIYNEDASNFSTKYIRNKIRHKIIPILEEINPYFIETMSENIGRLKENFKIYEKAILEKKEKIFFYEKDLIFLKKLEIENLENKEIFFYEFLKDFGFNRIQSDKILKSFNAVGKQFFTSKMKKKFFL